MYSREEMETIAAALYADGYIKPAAMIRQLLASEERLREALEAVIDEYDLDQYGQKYHSIDRAREALNGKA